MPLLEGDKFNSTTRFKLTLNNLEVANFESVSGLNVSIDVQEYREGGENAFTHKLRGATRFSNLILRRGTTDSLDLWEWIDKCIKGEVERKSGSIIALSMGATDPVATWNFFDAFPCSYRGPDFSSRAQPELAIEELELAYSRFEMVQG